jgi:hypothetical protein
MGSRQVLLSGRIAVGRVRVVLKDGLEPLLSVILGAQRREIVQRRFGLGWVWRLGRQVFDGEVTLTILEKDRGQAQAPAVEIQFDLREVEWIKSQFQGAAGPLWVHLIAIALWLKAIL